MPNCSVPGCDEPLGEYGTWCKGHLEGLHPETYGEVYDDAE